jgi:hypothetical protein
MSTLLHVAGLAELCAKDKLQNSKQDVTHQKLPGPLVSMPKIETTDLPTTKTHSRISAREKSGLDGRFLRLR